MFVKNKPAADNTLCLKLYVWGMYSHRQVSVSNDTWGQQCITKEGIWKGTKAQIVYLRLRGSSQPTGVLSSFSHGAEEDERLHNHFLNESLTTEGTSKTKENRCLSALLYKFVLCTATKIQVVRFIECKSCKENASKLSPLKTKFYKSTIDVFQISLEASMLPSFSTCPSSSGHHNMFWKECQNQKLSEDIFHIAIYTYLYFCSHNNQRGWEKAQVYMSWITGNLFLQSLF